MYHIQNCAYTQNNCGTNKHNISTVRICNHPFFLVLHGTFGSIAIPTINFSRRKVFEDDTYNKNYKWSEKFHDEMNLNAKIIKKRQLESKI